MTSIAWLAVSLIGLAVVGVVFGMSMLPRLTSGQQVLDAAHPAFTDTRVAATRSGTEVLSQYVDVLDPLLTARGRGAREVRSLVRLVRRELGLSSEQARRILRREAPHTEALARALPLEGVAEELPGLTSYLSSTLTMSEDELAGVLERSFPQIAQLLTALPIVVGAWYDVPGIEGLTRVSRDKPVRTVPGLRKYLRDDLVARMSEHGDEVDDLAGRGGIGYIPIMLLIGGGVLVVGGLLLAARAATVAPPRPVWGVVALVGTLLVLLVVLAGYFPRLAGGEEAVAGIAPIFTQERVRGAATGFDTVHEAILLGDPLMARRPGAASEASRLYRFVGQRTGRSRADVRRALMRRAPQTIALLDALPLETVAREVPRLVRYLARALRRSRDRTTSLLRRRTPRLARSLLAVPPVTAGWNAIPRSEEMTRFDGARPVRTMPEFDAYLREDVLPVFVAEREHFEALDGRGPPFRTFPPVILGAGLLLMIYGGLMTFAPREE
ncbi:MAG TPA: hypothetical protein VGV67_12670 [Solirubrobacteraceae bacterium]|nr:hypothetical protein [Solirubrobacteraceae bacterium]